MARGQESTNTGGQIDPYVQQSLMQNRQLAENRLTTAMQEASAGQRQKQAARSESIQQGVQLGANAYQEAAQREQEDKRAAENERARREQQKFDDAQRKAHELFLAKESKLNQKHDLAVLEQNLKEAAKTREELQATRRVQMAIAAEANRRQDNMLHSVLRGTQMKQLGDEKILTADQQAIEQYDRDTEIYGKLRDKTIDYAGVELKNMPIEEKKTEVARRGLYEFGIHYEPAISDKEYLGPVKVLQKALDSGGTKITVEDLSPASIDKIRQGMVEGKITVSDIRNASAVLDGFLPAVEKQATNATGQSKILWQAAYERISNMQDSLESLRYDNSVKIKGREAQSVGSEVRRALGTKYPELAYGARMKQIREMTGNNDAQYLSEVSKGIEPIGLLSVDPKTMTPADIAATEEYNSIIRGTYPERFQEEVKASAWGAD